VLGGTGELDFGGLDVVRFWRLTDIRNRVSPANICSVLSGLEEGMLIQWNGSSFPGIPKEELFVSMLLVFSPRRIFIDWHNRARKTVCQNHTSRIRHSLLYQPSPRVYLPKAPFAYRKQSWVPRCVFGGSHTFEYFSSC